MTAAPTIRKASMTASPAKVSAMLRRSDGPPSQAEPG